MTKFKHDIDQIYSTLLSRNYQTELFANLNQFKQEGNGQYKACCPFHNDDDPSFSIAADKPTWYCHGCGKTGNWIKYLEETENLSFYQALEKLALAAGNSINQNTTTNKEEMIPEEPNIDYDLMEAAMDFYQNQLFEKSGKPALDYLIKRGFTEAEIKEIGFGFNPGNSQIKGHLILEKYNPASIDETLEYEQHRDEYQVVIPYYDPNGKLIGIWARYTGSADIKQKKYMPISTGAKKETLFNFHQSDNQQELVIMEGFFDCLLAAQKDINAVAVIGSSLLKKQVENLKGFSHVKLAFDNDQAGQEGTKKAIDLLLDNNIQSSVVEYPKEITAKDPADWINEAGASSLKIEIELAKDGIDWKWDQIAVEKESDGIKEIKEYCQLIKRMSKDKQDDYTEILVDRFPEQKDRMAHLLSGDANHPPTQPNSTAKSQPVSLRDYIKNKFTKESQKDKEYLGFEMKMFKKTCQHTDGIQPGFYLLGAETNIGKTACLVNMFIDLIISNPGVKGIYFSLDDSKDIIINRLIGILTNLPLNQLQRKQGQQDYANTNQAYQTLDKLIAEDRLDIKDLGEVKHINSCTDIIKENVNRPLFIIIDGLYNLDVDSSSGQTREMNIDRANQIKALVDIHRIPVICSGELRKKATGDSAKKKPTLSDIMETGKLAYNANIVWLLYPKDIKKFAQDDEPVLTLEFAKNKLSHFRSEIDLKFIRKTGKIEEV
jgi:DNA primase catalytic core